MGTYVIISCNIFSVGSGVFFISFQRKRNEDLKEEAEEKVGSLKSDLRIN